MEELQVYRGRVHKGSKARARAAWEAEGEREKAKTAAEKEKEQQKVIGVASVRLSELLSAAAEEVPMPPPRLSRSVAV